MLVVTVYFPASPLSCILSQEPAVQNPDMFELFYYPCASMPEQIFVDGYYDIGKIYIR